jgi:hypothetical protein
MATIVTRSSKGSALTHTEMDSNFSNLNNGKVETTGNETIAGVKTFSSFPITPSSAPSSDYETANKKYVDDEVAGIDLTGYIQDTAHSFSTNGYQKLSNGLIIQWGRSTTSSETFPISFNTLYSVTVTVSKASGGLYYDIDSYSNSGFTLGASSGYDLYFWFAIGY